MEMASNVRFMEWEELGLRLLAMVIFAGVRSRIEDTKIPERFRGLPATLIAASFVSLAFFGFEGIVENLFK